MTTRKISPRAQSGFTLIEILIALTLVTILTMAVSSSLAPWLDFRSKIDTQRRLEETRTLFSAAYDANAMSVDSNSNPGEFRLSTGTLKSSVVPTVASGQPRNCPDNAKQFAILAGYLPSSDSLSGQDGYHNSFCVFVSNSLSVQNMGVPTYYHNIALVSPGKNGQLEAGTAFDPTTGVLTLDPQGDDTGVVLNGVLLEQAKIKDIQTKLDRIASLYETYFSIRFQANPARDITVDYFNQLYDTAGTVPSTAGTPQDASLILTSIGVGQSDSITQYENNNTIVVGNYSESFTTGANTLQVKSPQTKGQTLPPYTALIAAQIPAGNGITYLVRTAASNY